MKPEALRNIIAAGVQQVAERQTTALSPFEVPAVTNAVVKEILPAVAHATNTEPWYQSRVTWGAIGAIVLPLIGFFGVTSDIISLDEFVVGGMALGSAVSGALTLYGRWKARKPIGVA